MTFSNNDSSKNKNFAELGKKLSAIKNESLISNSIILAVRSKNIPGVVKMVQQQAQDNRQMMVGILGEELLTEVINFQ